MDVAPIEQTYRERLPAAPLRRYLSSVWVQWVSPEAGPYTHRTVPNAGIELMCELGSTPQVVGPQNGPTAETLAPGTTVVGVRFQPGAAPAALGLPASELLDLTVGSDELWGRAGARLGEKLSECGSPDEAATLLEHEVLARLGGEDELDPVVGESVRRLLPGHGTEVRELSSSAYLSERQLHRRFLAAIGLAPKTVQRVLRFQGFLARANATGLERANLAELAAQAGYADQPHLTRESMRLSGQSPRALLRDAEKHCRGIHDHAASYAPLLRSQGLRLRG